MVNCKLRMGNCEAEGGYQQIRESGWRESEDQEIRSGRAAAFWPSGGQKTTEKGPKTRQIGQKTPKKRQNRAKKRKIYEEFDYFLRKTKPMLRWVRVNE